MLNGRWSQFDETANKTFLGEYHQAGFVVSVAGYGNTLTSVVAYDSIIANNKTVSANSITGGECDLFFTQSVKVAETFGAGTTVTAKPFIELRDGRTFYGNQVSFTLGQLQ